MTTWIKELAEARIVDSIDDAPGVETLEGRIGPLLNGFKGAAHYIVMPPGMYCAEHTHSTESIIFTAKGQWVLCSEGKRHHMLEGSVFFMPPDIPTGYEVPFSEPATLFIVKFEGPNDPEAFLEYLKGMAGRLEDDHGSGVPFNLHELEEDHPARSFARSLSDNLTSL
jgi:quercetin dioxygenase-like cupin family protein